MSIVNKRIRENGVEGETGERRTETRRRLWWRRKGEEEGEEAGSGKDRAVGDNTGIVYKDFRRDFHSQYQRYLGAGGEMEWEMAGGNRFRAEMK